MARFLHLADLHLGAKFAFLEPDKQDLRRKDQQDAFIRAVDYALDTNNKINAVWIVGDLFDMIEPPDNLVELVEEQFWRLADKGIEIFLVPGTHDPSIYPESVYRKKHFSGVTFLNQYNMGEPVRKRYDEQDFYFYGFEYHPIYSKPPFGKIQKKEAPGFHVALIHGSLLLSNHWKSDDAYIPLDPEHLAETGIDYFALGHYHNFMEEKLGQSLVVYPGTLEGRKFNETGDRFLVVVEFENNKVQLQKIPWNKRLMAVMELDMSGDTIENEVDIIKALKTYADLGKNILLKVKITGSTEFIVPVDKILNEMTPEFFYIDIQDHTELIDSRAMERVAAERSVRGLFVRKILGKLMDADEREKKLLTNALRLAMIRMQGGESLEI